MNKTFSISVTLLRLLLAAWIGAAILYVITSVAEQTSPNFDSVTRDQLATVRFPLYYQFGFVVHIVAAFLAVFAWLSARAIASRRFLAVMLLVFVSFVLFVLDYHFVYTPLQNSIIPPGQARTQDFVKLHTWSRHANEAHLMVAFIATLLAAIPVRAAAPGLAPTGRDCAVDHD